MNNNIPTKPLMDGVSDPVKLWALDLLTILAQEQPNAPIAQVLITVFKYILEVDAKAKEDNVRT